MSFFDDVEEPGLSRPARAQTRRTRRAGRPPAVQQKFPGYRFMPHGSVDSHGPYLRFSWALADARGVALARGTDVATLSDDGRLQSVIGFIDQAPGS